MASAWGKAWGLAFGAAFGLVAEPAPPPQVYGSGKTVSRRHVDELDRETVEKQWELLELRLKNAEKPAIALVESAPVATNLIASEPQIDAKEAQRRRNQAAIAMILADLA